MFRGGAGQANNVLEELCKFTLHKEAETINLRDYLLEVKEESQAVFERKQGDKKDYLFVKA